MFYNTCWKWHLTQACKWEPGMRPLTLTWYRLNTTATQINMGTIVNLQWMSPTCGLLELCDSISQRQKRTHSQWGKGRIGEERSTNHWKVRLKHSWNIWLRRKEAHNFVRNYVKKNVRQGTQGKAYNYNFAYRVISRGRNFTNIFSTGKNGRGTSRCGRRGRLISVEEVAQFHRRASQGWRRNGPYSCPNDLLWTTTPGKQWK